MANYGNFKKEDIDERIMVWLLNGVTFREIEDRLNWLGISVSEKEIEELQWGAK